MGTRNTTLTGYFLRKRLKRHIVLRVWNLVRDVILGREQAAIWQPTTPCLCCQAQIEQHAVFCPRCGTLQQRSNGPMVGRVQRKRETEKLPVVLPTPIRETEAINRLASVSDEPTARLYSVHMGQARPIHQYLAEQKRQQVEQLRAELAQLEEQLVQQRAEYPLSRYTGDLELVAARLRKELAENGTAAKS